jgi:hypothetical protein
MNNPNNSASSVDGPQNRRLACDRCRAQKLKCTRPELFGACQRCRKADTPCSFGRPQPPGRPKTANAAAAQNLARGQSGNPRSPINAPPLSSGAGEEVQHQMLQATRERQPAVDQSCSEEAWFLNSMLDSESLNPPCDDAFVADLDSSNFGVWSPGSNTLQHSSWPGIEHAHTSSTDLMHQLTNSGVLVTAGESALSPLAQETDLIMSPPTLDHAQVNQTASSVKGNVPTSGGATPSSGRLGDAGSPLNPAALVQKVTDLGNVMYEVQSFYSRGEHGSRATTALSETFPTDLSGKVLQVTIELLGVLQCFLDDRPASHSSTSSSSPHLSRPPSVTNLGSFNPDRNPLRNPLHAAGLYQMRPDTLSHSLPSYSSRSSSASSSTEWSPRRAYAADKPVTLQLIATYLRLLQLYQLLFGSIYDYVRCTESASRRNQPIWKNLTLGDAPLHQFADFQIKFVLQLAWRLLEGIEGALGLSDRCRVSKKSAAEGDGIVGTNVTSHFVEMCMTDATSGAEQGRGVIARLRKTMNCLMDILDVPILS